MAQLGINLTSDFALKTEEKTILYKFSAIQSGIEPQRGVYGYFIPNAKGIAEALNKAYDLQREDDDLDELNPDGAV